MVSVGSYLIGFLFLLIICYALMKQSEELDWYRLSIGRQSLDEESVYLKNTKTEPGDTCKDFNERMVSVGSYLIGFLFSVIIFYALMKEREELGCYRLSIGRQCLDEESVYLKNTKAEPGDKCKDLYERMVSILSYQEKGGAWKRCIIIATIITFFVYIVYSINNKLNNISHYAVLLLVIFTLQYFYQNYINYHHFRKLKQNGVEILQLIKQKCKK
jgi:hypothetical protein